MRWLWTRIAALFRWVFAGMPPMPAPSRLPDQSPPLKAPPPPAPPPMSYELPDYRPRCGIAGCASKARPLCSAESCAEHCARLCPGTLCIARLAMGTFTTTITRKKGTAPHLCHDGRCKGAGLRKHYCHDLNCKGGNVQQARTNECPTCGAKPGEACAEPHGN